MDATATDGMSTMNAPQISCVMACYNAMPYLPDAVGSIQRQSVRDWELIVVNDGSTDQSGTWLRNAAQSDPRIRVIDQENAGQQAAANRGIEAARSNWIARMDADDIASPNRFAVQMKYLAANPDVGLLGGQIERLGSRRSGLASNFPLDHDGIVAALMQNHHSLCNPTVIFRRDLFEQIGGYWSHNIAEDWDLFLRMAEVTRLANTPDTVLSYRFHTGSINGRRIVEAQLFNEYAADAARRRSSGQPAVTMDQFRAEHRSNRWPQSWLFYCDSQSIGQYREAIAEIYDGRSMVGYGRLALAAVMSPARAIRRVQNIISGRLGVG